MRLRYRAAWNVALDAAKDRPKPVLAFLARHMKQDVPAYVVSGWAETEATLSNAMKASVPKLFLVRDGDVVLRTLKGPCVCDGVVSDPFYAVEDLDVLLDVTRAVTKASGLRARVKLAIEEAFV